jgi:hypothetical protein
LIGSPHNIPYVEGDTEAMPFTSQPLNLRIFKARHYAIGRYGINQSLSVISFYANVIIRNADSEFPPIEMQFTCSSSSRCEAEVVNGLIMDREKRYSVFIRIEASTLSVTLQDQTGSFATWKSQ